MVDTVSAITRSRIMASIKGKDTTPEIMLRKALSVKGYKYRKNYHIGRKTIDIAFVGRKVAVLVDGCFWHGCPRHHKLPKSNLEYWKMKIMANVKRDSITDYELKAEGWHVIRIWEHDLRDNTAMCVSRVERLAKLI